MKKFLQHFYDEQQSMAEFNYPARAAHQGQHLELYEKAREILRRLSDETMNFAPQLSDYLEAWLAHHVTGPDRALGLFLAQKGSR
jgi:hemerythrin-like metal-binding protein